MAIWTFYDYVSQSGSNAIADWVQNELSAKGEEKFEARLDYLGGVERHEWGRPHFSLLKNCDGISEIRFDVDKVEYRVFGFFRHERHEYAMVLGWIKKNGDYRHQCRIAIPRMKLIQSTGRRHIREHGT